MLKFSLIFIIVLTLASGCNNSSEPREGSTKASKSVASTEGQKTSSPNNPSASSEEEFIKELVELYGSDIQTIANAAKGGDHTASFFLSEIYLNKSFHNKPDLESIVRKAGFLYAKNAANSNDPAALYLLSKAYGKGKGTIKSDALAVELLDTSGKMNFAPALDSLCANYYSGSGVEKDERKALTYGLSAIKNGFPKGKSCASRLQLGGSGEALLEAVRKIEESRPNAIISLKSTRFPAHEFVYGEMPTPLTRAAFDKWLSLASAGKRYAQQRVANMLYAGDGIESDPVVAYAWALLATQDPSMNGWSISIEGNRAIPALSTKQKNEGERLASEWKVGMIVKR